MESERERERERGREREAASQRKMIEMTEERTSMCQEVFNKMAAEILSCFAFKTVGEELESKRQGEQEKIA